jgi:polysaccharide export outer membrane protein
MMRTAILFAILVAIPVWLSAGGDSEPKPPEEQTAQQPEQKAEAQLPVQSPKATIPTGLPNGEQPVKPLAPTAPETDPIKLAAPLAPAGAKPAATPPPGEKTYVIGAEDQLNIVVWGNAPLSGQFIVAPDGRISMGLINEVTAWGLTRDQLQTEIVRRLKDGGFLRDPTVTVNVTGFNSKKYSINGEVNKPGSSPLVVPTTIMQALVNAGGFKDFANKSKIRILRGPKTFMFNWNQVVAGKHLEQNILLEPGDLIIVK